MNRPNSRSQALSIALVLAAMAACGGPSASRDPAEGRPALVRVEVGRLVDVYAYQRIDESVGDRRLRARRRLVLVERNAVVNGNIESQGLFNAAGEEVPTANYELRPFDKAVGHEELLILWDNRPGPEAANFAAALASAKQGLTPIADSYRGQNTTSRPIPVVPRNAAIKLTFSAPLDGDAQFFADNPSVVQVLEFKGDPAVVPPADAFRALPTRVLPQGNALIVDTTLLAGETNGATSPGLPLSADNSTANIRIAIPSRGGAANNFVIDDDAVPQLNGIDASGRSAVIRDFRSGNLADGVAGRLRDSEAPTLVASLAMGISEVDAQNGILRIEKRGEFVPVRGRVPFVDGALGASNIPLGPLAAPTQRSLENGDFIIQTVRVQMPSGAIETVQLRAEVLENLEIGSVQGDPRLGLAVAPEVGDSGQGELTPSIRVRVGSVSPGVDSLGRPVSFRGSSLAGGEACTVRVVYHEQVPFLGTAVNLSDRAWRSRFVRLDPRIGAGLVGRPNSSLAVEFSKPMDLDQIDNTANYLITSSPVVGETFDQKMTDAKRAKSRIVTTRLSDQGGDGTVLRLQPPTGFFHLDGASEDFALHIRTGPAGVLDLAGNQLQLFDNPSTPLSSWDVDFEMDPASLQNLAGHIGFFFSSEDEDGTLPGSADIFGQYRLENGQLLGATGIRFGRSADQAALLRVNRILRGECWGPGPGGVGAPPFAQAFPTAPTDAQGGAHPGRLYWTPRMVDSIGPNPIPAPSVYPFWQTLAQPVGRVIEPMTPQGSRMQMRYIEDDFGLSYKQPSEFGLDVEQLYWSPFSDETVRFDVFDRFTMTLSHAQRRTDEFWFWAPPAAPGQPPRCILGCPSMNSSLVDTFAENPVPSGTSVNVFQDKIYQINPNTAFRNSEGVTFVPFPRFDRTYTWRDSRLVSVDANGNVIGLGGALNPTAPGTAADFTANIDSPWITDGVGLTGAALDAFNAFIAAPGNTTWVQDSADFAGNLQRDHDPIALPLLVDFRVFTDDAVNGAATGINGFQMGMLGSPTFGFPGVYGYYDLRGSNCPGAGVPRWPRVRVHASGGYALNTGVEFTVDAGTVLAARPNVVRDAGLGSQDRALFAAPSGDGMLNWAHADFVRKVSTMTFGFFDTLQPQRGIFLNGTTPVPEAGFPDFASIPTIGTELRIADLIVQLDPPQARQPAGTSVVVEIRGVDVIAPLAPGNPGTVLYNPSFPGTGPFAPNNTAADRGQLLNPNYACEAYRYSQANVAGTPRVAANGLTPYVTEDQLGVIRNPAGLLPRFLNLRLVMNNNLAASPPVSPALRSVTLAYRVATAP